MKKTLLIIVCIIIGIGAGAGCYFLGYNANNDSSSSQKTPDVSYETEENDVFSEKSEIEINAYNNRSATLNDDVGFPLPSWELLNSYHREGNDIIYDMQNDGKGVLINAYSIGMQKVIATIFVTSDYGKNWEIVEKETTFYSGTLDVIYIGDTIAIINTEQVGMATILHISNDNGKTFTKESGDSLRFSQIIGESADFSLMAFPIVLSKDYEKNTVLCAWCNANYESDEVLLISEHYAPTFEITKEYYRNKTAIEKYSY